jgi:anhydro-N-acetylmuramic acid kinase
VVGDFRLADMAHGGQGAPLVPYFDYVCFASETETRGLLNLGGIANLTILPAGADASATRAFDTGPANMVSDSLAQHFFGVDYDAGGALAQQGEVDAALLARLLREDDYLALPPPKSTGRERYGADFAAQFHGLDGHDALATATAFTAHSVAESYRRFFEPGAAQPLGRVMASGGGVHNAALMRQLEEAFAPVPVRPLAAHGVDPDAKEAICFAVLAHEFLNGVPTGLPSVTGARKAAKLGVLALP